MRHAFLISCLVLIALAGGGIYFFTKDTVPAAPPGTSANVTESEGKQVIAIRAKGGYTPRLSVAKANVASTIRVETSGTYDCSLALTVPAVGFRDTLPSTGVTPIEIPPQSPGTSLRGVCSMGMYAFTVKFE